MVGLLAASATFSLFLIAALFWGWSVFYAPGPSAPAGDTTVVTLPSGSGVPAIAAILKQAGVIRSPDMFKAAVSLTGADRKLRAGEYEVPSRTSLRSVIILLVEGRVVRHYVTLPEGWSSAQAVDILMRQSVLTGEPETPPEGSLWPDTYEISRGEPREAVIARMQRARDQNLARLWELRSPNSVVRSPGRGIRQSELQRQTPWNTYQIDGLPPTPIANPGKEALAAVLNPPRTDELFFVADGTGGHVFARTYTEHLANVAQWRAIERQKAGLPPEPIAPAPLESVPDGPVVPPGAAVITVQPAPALRPAPATR